MIHQGNREQDKTLGMGEGLIVLALLATISFVPLYIVARAFLSASRQEAFKFAAKGSVLGVPLMGLVYTLSCFGGVVLQGAVGEPRDVSMLVEPLFWAGFLPTYLLTSFGMIEVFSGEFPDLKPEFFRRASWVVSFWTAVLLTGLWMLMPSLDEFEEDADVQRPERSSPVQVEVPQPTPVPPPIQVTTMTSTGLESHLWNSEYHFLTGHRTLSLTLGQVVWDRAYVWITADYNSLVEAKITLLNSDSGKGVELDYQGISITVQGSRTINWSRYGSREVERDASGEIPPSF